jgi:GNAT superfamily N-acetyltransferase
VPTLTIHPLTPDRWPDFVRLFGEHGVGGGCWCMGWRLSRQQYLRQKGESNKHAMHALVRSGSVPGLLAYLGDTPIGWCSVGPREAYPALERSRSRRAIDAQPVWSITCLYVARPHRRKHLSGKLIAAAVRYVRSQGGSTVEAYPVPPKPSVGSTSYAFTGFVSAFNEAGFSLEALRTETRPVMRYFVRPGKEKSATSNTPLRRSSKVAARGHRG